MTDEEIWAVWDEVIDVNTGIDPVPFARAIEAARTTAEQSEPVAWMNPSEHDVSEAFVWQRQNWHHDYTVAVYRAPAEVKE